MRELKEERTERRNRGRKDESEELFVTTSIPRQKLFRLRKNRKKKELREGAEEERVRGKSKKLKAWKIQKDKGGEGHGKESVYTVKKRTEGKGET